MGLFRVSADPYKNLMILEVEIGSTNFFFHQTTNFSISSERPPNLFPNRLLQEEWPTAQLFNVSPEGASSNPQTNWENVLGESK